MDETQKNHRTSGFNLIAFSTAAAATAAVVGVAAYLYIARKAGDPAQILSRCQSAIEQIQSELHTTSRA